MLLLDCIPHACLSIELEVQGSCRFVNQEWWHAFMHEVDIKLISKHWEHLVNVSRPLPARISMTCLGGSDASHTIDCLHL